VGSVRPKYCWNFNWAISLTHKYTTPQDNSIISCWSECLLLQCMAWMDSDDGTVMSRRFIILYNYIIFFLNALNTDIWITGMCAHISNTKHYVWFGIHRNVRNVLFARQNFWNLRLANLHVWSTKLCTCFYTWLQLLVRSGTVKAHLTVTVDRCLLLWKNAMHTTLRYVTLR